MSLYLGNKKIPTVNIRLSSAASGTGNFQNKTVTPLTSAQTILPDSGYDALRQVIVQAIPSSYIIPSGNKAITANGANIDVKNYATVSVNVPTGSTINNQNKTVTPTESNQSISADSGYTGLGTVTVNAISSTYVGSGITQRNSSSLTVSGATVSVPAGYYASAASKAVSSMTLPTAVSTSSSGTSKLSITPTTAARYLNIPTGYNGTASYYTIAGDSNLIASNIRSGVSIFGVAGSYTGSGGTTINNQNKTVTPTTSQQSITFDSGYTGLGTVTVNAISTQTKSVSPTTASQDVVPDSGKYLTKVTVAAMPTMTLPTAATTSATSGFSSKATIGRSTADQYINIPIGYNSAGAYYKISAVANGSVNNPTASKGTVSNNSISITPSVTSTTGYITGGTKTGTAVTVSASELVSGTLDITTNGTKDVTNYANVNVNISGDSPTIETLTVTPSESEQTFNSSSVDGYKPVTVGAISNDYVGSGILRTSAIIPYSIGTHTDTYYVINMVPIDNFYFTKAAPAWVPKNYFGTATAAQVLSGATFTSASGLAIEGTIESKSSTDITVSGATVNVPAGYYSEAASKSVASGTTTAPTSISGTAASVSTGTNTLTLTKTVSVTPNVTTAGYISSGTAGNSTVTLTANVTTKGAATITPGTSNQTIASGTYLTGIQTIAGDSDLVAANIKSGVQIFNVTGTFTNDATSTAADILSGKTAYASGTKLTGTLNFITVYTGTSAPSSSLGVNGDIYIQS